MIGRISSFVESEAMRGRNTHDEVAPHAGLANSHRVGGNKTADDDAAAMTYVPHHGLADRIAVIANDGAIGHCHPLAFDRHPIGAVANVVGGAMAVGDIAAGHAVRCDHTLEPGPNVGWDVFILAVIDGERGACGHRQAHEQNELRKPSHPIPRCVVLIESCR